VLTPCTVWAAWQHRDRAWVRVAALYVVVVPVLTVVLAPAVATHGTLYRSGAAMMGAHLALGAVGLSAFAAWGERVREYPRPFLPGLLGGAFLLITVGMGAQRAMTPERPSDCGPLAELTETAVVFSSRPLELEVVCGRTGVMVTRGTSPERMRMLAERYGVTHAVVSPDRWMDEGSVAGRHIEQALPDWVKVGPRVYRAP
jgi:hypothetical protein